MALDIVIIVLHEFSENQKEVNNLEIFNVPVGNILQKH
jgi:hypothetical protein